MKVLDGTFMAKKLTIKRMINAAKLYKKIANFIKRKDKILFLIISQLIRLYKNCQLISLNNRKKGHCTAGEECMMRMKLSTISMNAIKFIIKNYKETLGRMPRELRLLWK
eukprot:GHVR01186587.1.p1 GENE.GHVR01186587.1~~GHVR01186587.1.p1  ORF type:complete len:110 (+),score=3.13 GHVR01186587.1:1104-1433(+)